MASCTILLENASDNKLACEKAFEVLASGGVVAFPTDTVFGIGVDAANDEAVERLYKIKKRERSKPLVALVGSEEQAKQIAPQWGSEATELAAAFWPGALTIVSGGMGLRLPNHKLAQELAKRTKGALLTTSANISGMPEAHSASEVTEFLGDAVDLILDDSAIGHAPREALPSTVVIIRDEDIEVVRVGAISKEQINEVVSGVIK